MIGAIWLATAITTFCTLIQGLVALHEYLKKSPGSPLPRRVIFTLCMLLAFSGFSAYVLLPGSTNAQSSQEPGVTTTPSIASSTALSPTAVPEQPTNIPVLTPTSAIINNAPISTPTSAPINNTPSPTPTTPPAPTKVAVQQTYEAEAQGTTIVSPAYIEKCPKCSGGHMVASVGYNTMTNPPSEGSLQFNGVYAPRTGTYTVTISYCLSSTVEGNILVNNSTTITVTYSSAGNECWQDTAAGPKGMTVGIPLQQGTNTLKLTTPQSPGTMGTIPSIDCIILNTSS